MSLKTSEKLCFLCGKPKQQEHHLIFGRGLRPLCDEDGITAAVCCGCHMLIHESEKLGTASKIIGQLQYEMDRVNEGIEPCRAREMFRERYGRSWL